MRCSHCKKPVDSKANWGWWSITDIFEQPGGYVPVHEACRKNWDRTAIPPAGVDIIPKITLEAIRQTFAKD